MATLVGFEHHQHLLVDQPVTRQFVAGEDIGIPASPPAYPLAPTYTSGYILYIDTDATVKLMTSAKYDSYIGVSEGAAESGQYITVRFWGIVYLVVGDTGAIVAGDLVKPDHAGTIAGDIAKWTGHTDLVAGDNVNCLMGKALAGGAARSGGTVKTVPVLLKGW